VSAATLENHVRGLGDESSITENAPFYGLLVEMVTSFVSVMV